VLFFSLSFSFLLRGGGPNVEFSEREHEVRKLICEEKTAAEIAKEIFLSPRSVEGIRRLIEKVGVRNTAGLVMFAIKNGIVT
jgi:DNA-binding CsgD family transcriptional regulator